MAARPEDRLLYRLPSFQRKLDRTLALIDDALAQMRRPLIAFSGGKDSTVLLHLVLSREPNATVLWFDDELEFPETVAFITETAAQVVRHFRPAFGTAQHGGWFTPWTDRPYWRSSLPATTPLGPDYGAAEYDGNFVGLRMAEKARRRTHLRAQGPLYRSASGQWRCNPLAGWTTADVWALIAGWGLLANPVYDRLAAVGVARAQQRVGPLPLTPGWMLRAGWPDLSRRLVERYGPRW